MCSAPDVPKPVERQAIRVPEDPALTAKDGGAGRRRLALAGLMTGPQGALGMANIGKATLG
jgi:hypothetical protein